MSGYPPDWPKCVYCGDAALDGHLTCGRVTCSEAQAREDRRRIRRRDPDPKMLETYDAEELSRFRDAHRRDEHDATRCAACAVIRRRLGDL